jgi:hypothetical protein
MFSLMHLFQQRPITTFAKASLACRQMISKTQPGIAGVAARRLRFSKLQTDKLKKHIGHSS